MSEVSGSIGVNRGDGARRRGMREKIQMHGPTIEVTSKMIEAGVDAFYDLPEILGPSVEQLGETLKRAFIAMVEIQRGYRS